MEIPANETQYKFQIAGLNADTFSVKGFNSSNHNLTTNYSYQIEITADYIVTPEALTDKAAVLTINWGLDKVYVHGIISNWQCTGKNIDTSKFAYLITLQSSLYLLNKDKHINIYQNQSAIDITKQILEQAGWQSNQYQIKTQTNYPKQEYLVQLNETDLQFLERIWSHAGIFYNFDQQQDQAILQILDAINQLPEFPDKILNYHDEIAANRTEESIYQFNEKFVSLSDHFILKNYNYETPEQPLEITTKNQTKISGQGCHYLYGCNYNTVTAGQKLADCYQQATDWQRHTFIIQTDCRGLQPGQKFTLKNHQDAKYNTNYRILKMSNQADQKASQQLGEDNQDPEATYKAELLLIAEAVPYKTYPLTAPEYHHIIPAIIESTGEYPQLDAQGRYHVRFCFDQSKAPKAEATCPIRAMQPYGGYYKNNQATGIHFPLHDGTKVAVGFIEGDINRPIILGVMANVDNPAPITSSNYTQNIIRTFGGHELIMEDLEGQQFISLATRDQNNQVKLDATDDSHNIDITSKQGQINAYAKKDINLKVGADHVIQSGQDQITQITGNQQLLAQNQQIEHQSGRDALYQAAQNLIMQTDADFNTNAAENLQINTGKDLHLTSKDINITTAKNDLTIHSDKDLIFQGTGNQDIYIGNNQYGIAITKDGIVNLKGKTVTFEAPEINIYNNTALNPGITVTSKTTQPTATQSNMYPSAEVKIVAWDLTLPPRPFKRGESLYIITASNLLDANLKVSNKNSVNPVTFGKEGFQVEAKNEIIKIFSEIKIKNLSSIIGEQPALTLYTDQEEYTFALTPTVITENQKQFTGTLSKKESMNDGDWTIIGEVTMNLTVTLSKNQQIGAESKSLVYDLEYYMEQIRRMLVSLGNSTALVLKQNAPVIGTITILTVILLATPVGV